MKQSERPRGQEVSRKPNQLSRPTDARVLSSSKNHEMEMAMLCNFIFHYGKISFSPTIRWIPEVH